MQAFNLESSVQFVQMIMCAVSIPSCETFILWAETVAREKKEKNNNKKEKRRRNLEREERRKPTLKGENSQ